MIRSSWPMPSESSVSAACLSVAQSDWLPMRMATGGVGSIMMDDVRRKRMAADYSAATLHRKKTGRTPGSRNDVGQKLILEHADTIFERELPLLHPLDADGVRPAGLHHGRNRRIEVAVLLAKLGQLAPDVRFLILGQAPAT